VPWAEFTWEMPTELYRPEKRFFTEQDFAQMSWRDNPIHAIAFGPGPDELSLDIDYIFKCELASSASGHETFWVSPATLVFEDVFDLRIKHKAEAALTLLAIKREEVRRSKLHKKLWRWRMTCVEAEWSFCATGYRQLIRKPPELVGRRRLDPSERGGYNLACPNRGSP
jgi:hypothetical protein